MIRGAEWLQRVWADRPLRTKGLVLVSIPLAPLAVTVLMFNSTQRRGSSAQGLVSHTYQVKAELQRATTVLVDAETGTRGYLLTRNRAWLEPYESARQQLPGSLARLEELLADSPSQRALLARARSLADRQLTALAGLADAVDRSGQPVSQMDPAVLLHVKALMDAFRGVLRQLESVQDQLAAERRARARAARQTSRAVIAASAVLGIAGGVVATLLFTAGISSRMRRLTDNAERLAAGSALLSPLEGQDEVGQLDQRLHEAAKLLSDRDRDLRERFAELRHAADEIHDLYNHAACGYHSLDREGRFLRINDTELGWLGYTRDEVIGRLAFSDILTEAGKARFPNLFAEFKRTGRVDDLEFELVRKDGSLLPVSVSATAVRDDAGNLLASRGSMFDIQKRKAAERALQQKNQELGALNQELEAFSYSVSHDLRAPLRHVDGFAALLDKSISSKVSDRERHYLQTIRESTVRMGRLIDDLLAFSRMGRNEMIKTRVDLARLVEEIRHDLLPECESRCVTWNIHPLPIVEGDPSMLHLALFNLMANAVKYTRPRATAVIEVGSHHNAAGENVVFVRDNGVGFDMTYQNKLFGVFQRLHGSTEFEGTGIGLANVRRIVHRHGGRTWAEGAVDRGATFYLALPNGGGCTPHEYRTEAYSACRG